MRDRIRSALQLCDSTYVSYLFPPLHSNFFASTCVYAMLSGLLGEESMSYTWYKYTGRHINELACTDIEEYARSNYLFNNGLCTDDLYSYRTRLISNDFEHTSNLVHCFVNVRWN